MVLLAPSTWIVMFPGILQGTCATSSIIVVPRRRHNRDLKCTDPVNVGLGSLAMVNRRPFNRVFKTTCRFLDFCPVLIQGMISRRTRYKPFTPEEGGVYGVVCHGPGD
jgi:hypothetical protein